MHEIQVQHIKSIITGVTTMPTFFVKEKTTGIQEFVINIDSFYNGEIHLEAFSKNSSDIIE